MFFNMLNIIVYYTGKEMNSLLNGMLLEISLSDFTVASLFSIWNWYQSRGERKFVGSIIIYDTVILFHNISLCLETAMAASRYVAVLHSLQSRLRCPPERIRTATIVCPLIAVSMTVPIYARDICADIVGNHRCANLTIFAAIEYTFLLKFVPCVLLAFFTFRLTSAMHEKQKFRLSLCSDCRIAIVHNRMMARSTRMILYVTVLVLLNETLNGVCSLLDLLVELPSISDTLDALVLVQVSAKFAIYYRMNKNFKTAANNLFLFRFLLRT